VKRFVLQGGMVVKTFDCAGKGTLYVSLVEVAHCALDEVAGRQKVILN
jgi:hypothetical protein